MQIKYSGKVVGVRLLLLSFAATAVLGLISPALAHAADPTTTAVWSDQASIMITNGLDNSDTFTTAKTDGNTMELDDTVTTGKGRCNDLPDFLMVDNFESASSAVLHTAGFDNFGGCTDDTHAVTLTNIFADAPPPSGGTSGSTSEGCPIDKSDWLRFVLCPIYDDAHVVTGHINDIISSALYFPVEQVFGSTPVLGSDGKTVGTADLQNAYNTFRNIGISLLVLAGLFMVFSQSTGIEIFSAHTVRKALPRIALAAIGMALAWPILQFTIIFFNDLGTWVGQIILSAAHVSTGSSMTGPGSILQNIGTVMIGLIAGVTFLGGLGLISLLGTAFLALLVALLVLAIRQLVILLCILLAPLAIASSVLPGTEKLWHFWRDTLLGALLMFPIIMGFLASGAAMSSIAAAAGAASSSGSHTGSQTTWDILAIIIFLAPYFLLPFSFRLASGLMGNIFGMVNDRNKGWFDRLSKFRGAKVAENTAKLKAGSRWNPDSRATKIFQGNRINSLGAHLGAGINGQFGIGRTGAVAMSNNTILDAGGGAKLDHNLAMQLANDPVMAAVAYGNDASKLATMEFFKKDLIGDNNLPVLDSQNRIVRVADDQKIGAAIAAGKTIKATRQIKTAALDALVQSGKIIDSRKELHDLVGNVSGGNQSMYDALLNDAQFKYRKGGRADLGRNTDTEAIKEMTVADWQRQKPKSAENLLGGAPQHEYFQNPNTRKLEPRLLQNSPMDNAMASNLSPGEKQQIVDVLYNLDNSSYISPEVQKYVGTTTEKLRADKDPKSRWRQAQENYQNKFRGVQAAKDAEAQIQQQQQQQQQPPQQQP